MLLKRVISAAAAVAAALTFSVSSVCADEADSKEAIPFSADGSMLTSDKSAPTLSFDSDTFKDYIHLTRDADKGGIKFSQDRDTYYQGASMRVSASTDGVDGYMSCSGMVRDSDNNLVYPDAPDAEETDKISIIGIELDAADYGLSCFDGCMVTFAYRLTAEDADALLDGTVWVFPATEDNERVGEPIKLTVNTTLDDNVSQYRKSYVSVGEEVSATKIIFEIPTVGALKGDALFLDNLTVQLPDAVGDNKYVENLDGYNANAQVRDTIEELKITEQGRTLDSSDNVEKSSDKVNPLSIVIICVAVVAVGVVAFITIKKMRNRFY